MIIKNSTSELRAGKGFDPGSNRGNRTRESSSTFGVICLLAFCFVIMSQKIAIGEISAVGAFAAALARSKPFMVPHYFRWYLLYFVLGVIGLAVTDYPYVVWDEILTLLRVIIIGLAAINLLTTARDQRIMVIGYLALFALFPVRGSLFNFVYGITSQGRIAWNFLFSNPNDLAMTCFLPLGLCAFLLLTEVGRIKIVAAVGLVVLFGVQILTQSRGAMIAFGVGATYFLLCSYNRLRILLFIALGALIAISLTPSGIWDRMAGLSKASVADMSQVDAEGSASGRWAVMGVGLGIAMKHPIFGVGVGAYEYAHSQATSRRDDLQPSERGQRDAHSMYIRSAAETGFFGAIAVIACVLSGIRFIRRVRIQIPNTVDWASRRLALLGLEASVVAYFVGAIFNSAERSTYTIWQLVIPCSIAALMASQFKAEGLVTATNTLPGKSFDHRRRSVAKNR